MTMTTVLEFTVPGKAEPAGSKKAFVIKGTNRAVVTDANSKAKEWKQRVATAAQAAMTDEEYTELFEGPLQLTVVFWLEKPKTVDRPYPSVRPDVTKLLRGLEDAMTGIVYHDDAQIIIQHATKLYGQQRTEVVVQTV